MNPDEKRIVRDMWGEFLRERKDAAMSDGPKKMAGTKIGSVTLNTSQENQGQKQLKQWIQIYSGVKEVFEPYSVQEFNNIKSFYANYCDNDSVVFFQRASEILDFVWRNQMGEELPIKDRVKRNHYSKKVLNKLVDHINDEIEEYSDFKVDRVPFDWRLELAYKAIS